MASAAALVSSSTSPSLSRKAFSSFIQKPNISCCRGSPLSSLSTRKMFLKYPYTSRLHKRFKPFSPVMEWQDSKVKMEIDVPVSVAYDCYLDREAIPRWMPFISSVKILEDEPELSRWSLKYNAFGRDIEFSWLARNMQPIRNQKIHWRSMEGLPNRGAVRFFPKGDSSCVVELTVSYEVPQILLPVSSALRPFLESLLLRGLEGFAKFARSSAADSVS